MLERCEGPLNKSMSEHSLCRHWHCVCVCGGASALVGEDPLGHSLFNWGVKGGVAIYEVISTCEMVGEKSVLLCLYIWSPLMIGCLHVAIR